MTSSEQVSGVDTMEKDYKTDQIESQRPPYVRQIEEFDCRVFKRNRSGNLQLDITASINAGKIMDRFRLRDLEISYVRKKLKEEMDDPRNMEYLLWLQNRPDETKIEPHTVKGRPWYMKGLRFRQEDRLPADKSAEDNINLGYRTLNEIV
ncbi:hypothetical protein ACFL3V_07305 [Nanoarchaeota archaeon]